MTNVLKTTNKSIKIVLLVMCLFLLQSVLVNNVDAASKHGKTGTYNNKLYIAHEDIPAYMNSAKAQIQTTMNQGSQNAFVKALNKISIKVKNLTPMTKKFPSSLSLAKSYLWAGWLATYAEVKVKDCGNGVIVDVNGSVTSQ